MSVKGFIAPIAYTDHNFHEKWDALAKLRVAKPEKHYSASVFQAFLPPEAVSIGDLWRVKQDSVLTLLSQLHPNPRLKQINSDDSHAGWACLRAYNNRFAEIVFRIHAKFAFTDGELTPSQFAGYLIIDRVQEMIVAFKMHVPKTTLNFNAIWKPDKNEPGYITDIGFCPQMELRAGEQHVAQDHEFAVSITQSEAEHDLMLRFYKFQSINWVPLEEALEMAESQQKPIHVISVDGALADESC